MVDGPYLGIVVGGGIGALKGDGLHGYPAECGAARRQGAVLTTVHHDDHAVGSGAAGNRVVETDGAAVVDLCAADLPAHRVAARTARGKCHVAVICGGLEFAVATVIDDVEVHA